MVMKSGNFECIEASLEALSGGSGEYSFRSHIPMIGRAVCIGCIEHYDVSVWDRSAQVHITSVEDQLEVVLDDFRKDRNDRLVKISQLSFRGMRDYDVGPIDGFTALIQHSGQVRVATLHAGDQTPLPLSEAHALDFGLACRLAVEMHANRVVKTA